LTDFGRWEDLHFRGSLIGGETIAACSWGRRQLDIFAIASGAVGNTLTLELWHKYYDQSSESPWTRIDRGMYGICAVSPHQGRLDLFGVYTDNQLWHKWYITNGDRKNGVWSEWEPLGRGVVDPGPGLSQYGIGACSLGPSRIEVFALYRDQPHELLHKIYSDRWYPWGSLGSEGGLESAPTAVSRSGSDRIDLFARSNSVKGHLLHKRYENKRWTEWQTIGEGLALSNGAGACSPRPGKLDILIRDSNSRMWHGLMLDDGTRGWRDLTERIGGEILNTPTAVSDEPDKVQVFAQSRDGRSVLRTWYWYD
jgi:hypothetical protein